MKISTKGRYAIRMLLDLAEHKECGYISLKEISQRQKISKKYLEQIVPVLTKSKILQTTRGYQGGYKLTQTPDKYTIGYILQQTEGSLCPVSCVENDFQCENKPECAAYLLWKKLNKTINNFLDGITLQDIIDEKNKNISNNYVI